MPADGPGASHVDRSPIRPGFFPSSNSNVFNIGRSGRHNSASCLHAETQRWRGGVLHAAGRSALQYGDTAFRGAGDSWIHRCSDGAKQVDSVLYLHEGASLWEIKAIDAFSVVNDDIYIV